MYHKRELCVTHQGQMCAHHGRVPLQLLGAGMCVIGWGLLDSSGWESSCAHHDSARGHTMRYFQPTIFTMTAVILSCLGLGCHLHKAHWALNGLET